MRWESASGAGDDAVRAELQNWLRAPDERSFASTWSNVSRLLADRDRVCSWFTSVVSRRGPGVSDDFIRLASRHVAGMVDARFEEYWSLGASSVVWQVLYALGPSSRADWLCLLGDLSASRGDDEQATRRYELADRFGCSRAKGRLAQLGDYSAYRALLGGDIPGAVARLRGPSAAGGYRQLLRSAAELAGGGAARDQLATFGQAGPDARLYPAAKFLAAIVSLRDGDRRAAREGLTRVLESSADDDIAANARVILGLLDPDDHLVAAGTRALLARHQQRWPTRLLASPQAVLISVSRGDPALLAELGDAARGETGRTGLDVDLGVLCAQVARRLIAEAARAATRFRLDEAQGLLAQARHLLEQATSDDVGLMRERAGRLGEIIQRLTSASAPERGPDQGGYAALPADGVVFPWSQLAQRVWETATEGPNPGYRTAHHLAIACHARAYQLELLGGDAATVHWRQALRGWALLHANDAFWAFMSDHLSRVVADADRAEVAHAVDEVRAGLPAGLLDPHLTLVVRLKATHPARAKAHMDLIRGAPFPAAVTESRRMLTRGAGNKVRELARQGHFDQALDEAESWLRIDAGNIHMAEQALEVGIEAVTKAYGRNLDWADRVQPMLGRVQALVDPVRSELGLAAGGYPAGRPRTGDREAADRAEFTAKLARHEFWQGASGLVAASNRHGSAPDSELRPRMKTAASHLELATNLKLPRIAPYDQAVDLLVTAKKWERVLQGYRILGFW